MASLELTPLLPSPILPPSLTTSSGSCILQEYHSDPLPPPPVKECKGILYRDYVGRWKCSDPPQYPPCAAGYNPTVTTGAKSVGSMWPWQDRGYCRQACPAWMVDCGGSCHMPHVPCTSTSAHLCPLPPGGERWSLVLAARWVWWCVPPSYTVTRNKQRQHTRCHMRFCCVHVSQEAPGPEYLTQKLHIHVHLTAPCRLPHTS